MVITSRFDLEAEKPRGGRRRRQVKLNVHTEEKETEDSLVCKYKIIEMLKITSAAGWLRSEGRQQDM